MKTRYESALITGASRGLGKALALRLAKDGVRLALVARNEAALRETRAEILEKWGDHYPVVTIVGDVSHKEDIYAIAGQAQQAVGPIDLLIHNASQLGAVPLRLLMDTDCGSFESVLQTNLLGPFRLTKAIAGQMLLREHGLVLSISSDAAVEAYPKWGSYSISKSALDHLSTIFAVELRGSGVKFLSVDPGEMRTRMHADAVPDADPATLADPIEVAERIVRVIHESDRLESGSRL